jgi:choloylglycine hydrolase
MADVCKLRLLFIFLQLPDQNQTQVIFMNIRLHLVIAAGVILLSCTQCLACTIFLLHNPQQTLVAHSFDWNIGEGQIVINKRGQKKTAMLAFLGQNKPARWTSRYGSLTIGWVGQDLPTIGVNERGMLVASLLLEATRYAEPDPAYTPNSISQGQIKQYLLDTCATVAEALTQLERVQVVAMSRFGIHYFMADATGDAAVFEFLDGQLHVYHGADLPVAALTNSAYPVGLAGLGSEAQAIRATDTYGISTSEARFAKAAKAIEEFPQQKTADHMQWTFTALNTVRRTITQWQSVFDLRRRQIYLRTFNNPKTRVVALDDFDLNCFPRALYRDMDASTGAFLPLDPAERNDLLKSANRMLQLDQVTSTLIVNYPETISCDK